MMRDKNLRVLGLVLLLSVIVTLLPASSEGASKYKTLHKFTGGNDGYAPRASLILDREGNVYGTTQSGGDYDSGVVFELTPGPDGTWTEKIVHVFTGGNDGLEPYGSLIFDQAGSLYGTTFAGGPANAGVVFKLTPTTDGSWAEKVLHSFTGGNDGSAPSAGLIFDQAGSLYGTTSAGGPANGGVVFRLTLNSQGKWAESVLHSFTGHDGLVPAASLTFDPKGNLFGTTVFGGAGVGVVFELEPTADRSWTEKVLDSFTGGNDGGEPAAGLIFDQTGNLYGTTSGGGTHGWGVVFTLTPNAKGGWNETVLHNFAKHPAAQPLASLIFDVTGNIYGTALGDNETNLGAVFEITP